MIYLDNGATSFPKPQSVVRAMTDAMARCTNPGRGGYAAALRAQQVVYRCRERAAALFDCQPEQVVFTANCTQGLNMAIRSLVRPGTRVAISGFEHNAVTRPLHTLRADVHVFGRRLFDWEDTLAGLESALQAGAEAAVFTHVSNVFGYCLPVTEMARLCRQYQVPFILDAAQSAGVLPVQLKALGAAFIAMPGHKGLLGPQGTGLLLCNQLPEVLLAGGTGSSSLQQQMPDFLPDRGEAGTLNVPGIAGLSAGLAYLKKTGIDAVYAAEHRALRRCIAGLKELPLQVFSGPHQAATVSFVPPGDCQELADRLGRMGIAVRAGLHCAPLAHESAGTLATGTVRVSFGRDASPAQVRALLEGIKQRDS